MLAPPILAGPTSGCTRTDHQGDLAMNASPTNDPGRILVVGRSPSVLVDTVEILRGKGYAADATNQFDRVLDDYDAEDINVVVFGGMVPADTKQHLRQEICERNPHGTFVQIHVGYDEHQPAVHLTLHKAARVTVEARWHTPFTHPKPKST